MSGHDDELHRVTLAVRRCFSDTAEVEPTRSTEFYRHVAGEVLAALRSTPVVPCPACGGDNTCQRAVAVGAETWCHDCGAARRERLPERRGAGAT